MNLFKDCLRRFCKEKSYEYDQLQSDLYQYATFIYGGDLYENERIDSFLSIVNSMFWMSYREDFQSLSPQDPHTSDYGWGCTLRSTQMILAEALKRIYLGKEWTRYRFKEINPLTEGEKRELCYYLTILLFFVDNPSEACIYSIHNIFQNKINKEKQIGEWFGSCEVCMIMERIQKIQNRKRKKLLQKQQEHILKDFFAVPLYIYTSHDSVVETSVIQDYYTKTHASSVLLFIPIKLGLHSIDNELKQSLFYLLSINSCLGMITGTPRHSLYSFSVIMTHSTTSDCHNYKVPQLYHPINKFLYSLFDRNKDLFIDNYNLLCLDPHSLQQAVHLSSSTNIYKQIYEYKDTYHTSTSITSISIDDIDPSITLGYLFASLQEFDDFCTIIHTMEERLFKIGFTIIDKAQCNNHNIHYIDDYCLL